MVVAAIVVSNGSVHKSNYITCCRVAETTAAPLVLGAGVEAGASVKEVAREASGRDGVELAAISPEDGGAGVPDDFECVPLTLTLWARGASDALEAVETGEIGRSSSSLSTSDGDLRPNSNSPFALLDGAGV